MILFFYGPNSYEARRKLRAITDKYVAKNGDIGLERFYAPEADANQLTDALTTLPFLASTRLVIVEDLGQNKPLAEEVIKILNRVADSTNVVFCETAPDQRTSWFKQLVKIAKVEKFELLAGPPLLSWVQKKAGDFGGKIDRATASLLIQYAGNDQWRLTNELQKLVNFQSNINQVSIEQLVEPQFDNGIFDLIDALGAGNAKTAIELYYGLRGKREDPYKILGMIGWQLRNLLLVMAAGETLNWQASAIASKVKLAPYVVSKSLRSARQLGPKQLRQMYRQLVRTDWQLKRTPLDPDILIEHLLVNLSAKLAQAPTA